MLDLFDRHYFDWQARELCDAAPCSIVLPYVVEHFTPAQHGHSYSVFILVCSRENLFNSLRARPVLQKIQYRAGIQNVSPHFSRRCSRSFAWTIETELFLKQPRRRRMYFSLIGSKMRWSFSIRTAILVPLLYPASLLTRRGLRFSLWNSRW